MSVLGLCGMLLAAAAGADAGGEAGPRVTDVGAVAPDVLAE